MREKQAFFAMDINLCLNNNKTKIKKRQGKYSKPTRETKQTRQTKLTR
jgi:hypothetical protein